MRRDGRRKRCSESCRFGDRHCSPSRAAPPTHGPTYPVQRWEELYKDRVARSRRDGAWMEPGQLSREARQRVRCVAPLPPARSRPIPRLFLELRRDACSCRRNARQRRRRARFEALGEVALGEAAAYSEEGAGVAAALGCEEIARQRNLCRGGLCPDLSAVVSAKLPWIASVCSVPCTAVPLACTFKAAGCAD